MLGAGGGPALPAGILLLILLLTIWNPGSLALQAAASLGNIETRPTLSLMFLSARLLITGSGVAAGIALSLRRPGAVRLAKVSLVLFAAEAVARLSTGVDAGSAPPGTRLPLAIFIGLHNTAWFLYLQLSHRVRAVYGLESQSADRSVRLLDRRRLGGGD